jgi:hypothetical protein
VIEKHTNVIEHPGEVGSEGKIESQKTVEKIKERTVGILRKVVHQGSLRFNHSSLQVNQLQVNQLSLQINHSSLQDNQLQVNHSSLQFNHSVVQLDDSRVYYGSKNSYTKRNNYKYKWIYWRNICCGEFIRIRLGVTTGKSSSEVLNFSAKSRCGSLWSIDLIVCAPNFWNKVV